MSMISRLRVPTYGVNRKLVHATFLWRPNINMLELISAAIFRSSSSAILARTVLILGHRLAGLDRPE
jgi:hypothetical protein